MYIITKELIISEKFWDIHFNPLLNAFEIYWKDAQEDIREEVFKQYLLDFTNMAKDYKACGFLVDTRPYHYVMNPDFQAWHDNVIIPRYKEIGFRKIVFILNEENFIASLSVEQTFQEEQAQSQGFLLHFTDSLEVAKSYFQE